MENSRKASLLALDFILAGSAVVCLWKWGISGKALVTYVFIFCLVQAAWKDLQTRHIPDRTVLKAGMIGALSILFFPEITLLERGIGGLCVSLLLLIISLIRPGSFGGGDIKLMAASGLFLGWKSNLYAFALAVFLAGAYCLWMLFRGKLSRKGRIAFGPFLCAGIVVEVLRNCMEIT